MAAPPPGGSMAPRARQLQAAACDGADPPLDMALPHTRALAAVQQGECRTLLLG